MILGMTRVKIKKPMWFKIMMAVHFLTMKKARLMMMKNLKMPKKVMTMMM